MQIVIRLDDITPDMDLERFNRVKEVLDRYNIKPLLGVVPECCDVNLHKAEPMEDFWGFIHKLMDGEWSVAQHGTYHVYSTGESGILGINPFSEFAGLPYDVQYNKLRIGRDIMLKHGIHTEVFMAPGHTYDNNTVKALKELGFSTITDGLYTAPYEYEGIVCVPCRLSSYRKVSGLDTICLHTNLMDESAVIELEDFISEHRHDIIPFDVKRFIDIAVPCTSFVRITETRVLAKRRWKNRVANNVRLSWYLSYTCHGNASIKMLRRIIMIPLLFTSKYKGEK